MGTTEHAANIYDPEFVRDVFAQCLADEGLEVELVVFFFGCATGVVGRKP